MKAFYDDMALRRMAGENGWWNPMVVWLKVEGEVHFVREGQAFNELLKTKSISDEDEWFLIMHSGSTLMCEEGGINRNVNPVWWIILSVKSENLKVLIEVWKPMFTLAHNICWEYIWINREAVCTKYTWHKWEWSWRW